MNRKVSVILAVLIVVVATACSSSSSSSPTDVTDGSSSTYRTDAENVQEVVNTAIETYKDQGRDEAFKEVNDLLVGDSYVFVIDETGLVVAHGANMSLIGTTSILATERDEDGVIFLDRATADGAWISYAFKDPISGAELPKESLIRSYDGYIFGSGYYETSGYRTDAENVQAVVNAAINKYQELGREESFIELNDLLVGDSYAFVVDPDMEIVVAHGANAARIGQPTILSSERDEEGVKLLDRATEAGTWVTYIFEDPVSGAQLPKESFIRLYDGLVFGSGYYDRSGYRTDAENVQAVVNAAINKYQELGREESFMELNGLLVGDSYAFVVDPEREIVVAHGANAARIGQPTILSSERDEEGVKLLDRATEAGDWVTYIFEDPVSGAQLPKESFIRLYDGLVFGSGYYDRSGYRTDAENVQAVVNTAIETYKDQGRDEAFKEVNDLLVGDSYVFVLDETGLVVAVGSDLSLIGTTSILATERDEDGVILLDRATAGGAWVSYPFKDPISGAELPKESFIRSYDGYIFGSGYYETSGYRTDAENVQAVVNAAISNYQELGREESFREINDLLVGDSYAFVVDPEREIVVAHGANADRIGQPTILSSERDDEGVKLLDRATEAGDWVTYIFEDPVSGAQLPKESFIRLYDGLVFGSGYYDRSGYRTDAENVQAVVDAAISSYQELGREESFNELNGLLVGDSYAFVVERSGGIVVAHGADMSLLGMTSLLSIENESGVTLLEQATEDGAWVSYVFNDPVSGVELPKRSFLRLYDGLVFGSGYYDRSGYRTDAENVQAVVTAAISSYQELGREESFMELNGLLVGDSYAFVVERSGGIVVAHGADMSLLGMTSLLSIENESGVTLLEQATEDGAWVSYVFNDPVSGAELPKRSFLRLYDGLVFGSGYYDRSGYRTDAENVQAVVTAAISSYQELGREESFMELNGLLVGDSYAFVVDPEREIVVAHGANADRIGQPTILSSERDDEGVKLLDRATEAGDWVTYLFEDPVSGAELPKISFIRLYDGLVFGSGYYDTSGLDN